LYFSTTKHRTTPPAAPRVRAYRKTEAPTHVGSFRWDWNHNTHIYAYSHIPFFNNQTEAKAFNAALADFKAKGAEVFGISRVRLCVDGNGKMDGGGKRVRWLG
jgi:hypothetical protein